MRKSVAIFDFLKISVVAAAGVSLLSCAADAAQTFQNEDELTVVLGTELPRLLTGHEMHSRDTTRISDVPTGRGFGSDGRYYDIGPRGGRGVWKVEGDQLCVAPVRDPAAWTCQQIFRDRHGRYYAYSELLPIGGMLPYYEIYFQKVP